MATKEKYQFDARSEAIFENAAIGILVVNKSRVIEMANAYAHSMFQYTPGTLIGQLLDVLIPDHLRQKHQSLQENYMHMPSNREMGTGLSLLAKRQSGELFPVEISLSHFTEDTVPYFVAFVHDASFKKNAELNILKKQNEIEDLNAHLEQEVILRTEALTNTMQALQRSKAELEVALSKEKELGELKSRFVSMASHEFRTPLTTISSATDLIHKFKESSDQEKREKYLDKIRSSINHLTLILEEFLSVGKLEEGKVEVQYSYFNLPELVKEVLQDMQSLKKKGQNLVYAHSGAEVVLLDASLIKKILINLCSNALKFSDENKDIFITTDISEKLQLCVKDSGIGIALEDQKHLFDRFYRAANALNIKGTGLGLHIVGHYVKLLNGKIKLESELHKGTKVCVEFEEI